MHKIKFGFTDQEISNWEDRAYLLRGTSNVGVVLVHGWSAMPKQLLPLAEAIHRQGHTVSLPLLAGHGAVPEDLAHVTAEQWIENVVEAAENLRSEKSIQKVVVGGISMGGNLAVLAARRTKIDGIILFGAPVHLKNHFWIWIGSKLVPIFMSYVKKKYPRRVVKTSQRLKETSYQYFPVVSVKQCLEVIRRATFSLKHIFAPILILQTDEDYVVAKYSPWVIYNGVKSKMKKLQWIKTKNDSHVLNDTEMSDSVSIITNFIKEVECL